jgi:endoglycosylceramidase
VLTLALPVVIAACSASRAPATSAHHDAAAPSPDATHHDAARDAAPVDATHADATSHDAAPPPPGPVLPVAPVGHVGRWLTDADGRVLLVHGMNVVEKAAPYYPAAEGFSDADAIWLADNGFRVVRLGILATGLMPTPGVVDTGYIEQVDATVKDLASHGVYSFLDFHQDGWGPVVGSDGFPAWMPLTGNAVNTDAGLPLYYENNPALQQAFQSFWNDAAGPDGIGLQEDYVAMFAAVAKQFAAEPYVLGYDLFNEPWPGTTWSACLNDHAGCPSLDTGELGALYAKAVTAMRAAGDPHLIFGEPFVLFNFGLSVTSVPVPGGDSNAGLAFHVYPVTPAQAPAVVTNAVAWSASTGGALLNTEWGASVDPALLTTESLDLDSALVPWIFWSLSSELVPSFDASPGGTNLVATTAAALIQPYPLVVAGTPESLTIDPTGRTLSFRWSTAKPGSGSFEPGAVTTFEAPALTYPTGYTATATNGTVTSAPCALLLTVRADPGASKVTVDMKPGGTCP